MLDPLWEKNIIDSLTISKTYGLPIIFNPVGAGATKYRTTFSKKIINEFDVSVIRGNPSEILSLAPMTNLSNPTISKEVDSCIESNQALECAKTIAQQYHAINSINRQGLLRYRWQTGIQTI